MALRPLAPVFLSTAFFAIVLIASSVNLSSTPSNSNNFLYCLINAFFGSVKILSNAFSSRKSSETVTGTLPINSGIKPNLVRSSGITCLNNSSSLLSVFSIIWELNPIEPLSNLRSIIFPRPSKAPPHINKILVVSIGISSCWGCFLPPWGGTLASVPSNILSNACCTPSPETSLVIDTFSDFLVILSISSI